MAGGFCKHGRIWTTCKECGKDVIKASKGRRKSFDDADEPLLPTAAAQPRPIRAPPEEPEPTEFETDG
jgi:hypothetical protein